MKFLFFIEREFHIAMLAGIMRYIEINKLGEMAISGFAYKKSDNNTPGYGLRPEVVLEETGINVKFIEDALVYCPDITFMADFSYQHTEGLGKIVNIGHGTISKGWFFMDSTVSRRENCADLICVPGTIHKEILQKQVFKPIAVTGMPKLDHAFLMNDVEKKEVLRKLGLEQNNKTILFAPTFNPEFSLVPHLGEALAKVVPPYVNVIVKLHGVAPEEWVVLYENLATKNPNIRVSKNHDVAELLAVADVLLSDVSSVIYEFLAFEKPVIIFDSPEQTAYPNYNRESLEFKYRDVGLRFSDVKELPNLIFKALLNPELPASVKEIAQKFVSVRDGSSSKLIVEKALSLVDAPQENLMITFSEDEKFLGSLVAKFGNHYRLLNVGKATAEGVITQAPAVSKFGTLVDLVNQYQPQNIAVLSDKFRYSHCFADFLTAHLHYSSQAGFVLPLIYPQENAPIGMQDLLLHLSKNYIQDFAGTALQLTYSLSGQSKMLKYPPQSEVFAFSPTLLPKEFTKITDEELCWLEIITNGAKQGKYPLLAYDCLIMKENKPKNRGIHNKYFYRPNISEQKLKEDVAGDPFNPETIKNLMLFYFHTKKYETMEVYANMLYDPALINLYLATAYERQNLLDAATEALAKVEKHPDDEYSAEFYALKAKICLKKFATAEAEVYIKQALQYFPNSVNALIAKGTKELMKNNLDMACDAYIGILNVESSNTIALNALGYVAQLSHEWQKAKEFYKKTLHYDPENLEALNGLLACSHTLGNFSEIESALEEFLEIHPGNLDLLFVLGGIYFKEQKYAKVEELLARMELFDADYTGIEELKKQLTEVIE